MELISGLSHKILKKLKVNNTFNW